jgi:hypothetical protein
MIRVSARIHIIGALIPELIRNREKLRTNFWATIKKILIQFIKSVAWLTLICTIPAVGMCNLRHYTGGINYTSNTILFIVANVAWLIENMSKHTQYVGYLMPRIGSILYTLMI